MDELEKYYNYLKQNGADVPDTYASFKATLSDGSSGETYYNYLKKNGFDTPPTYESFATTFGLKKKRYSSIYNHFYTYSKQLCKWFAECWRYASSTFPKWRG